MKEPTEVTRTILHTRFILITSSTAGFMALPSSAAPGSGSQPLRVAGEGGAGATAAAPEDARAPAPRTGGR